LKLSFLKKVLLGGILTASLVAGMFIAVLPTVADPIETMSLQVSPASVANGASSITVTLVANSTQQVFGWGANVDFNQNELTVTSITYGTYLTDNGGDGSLSPAPHSSVSASNTAGVISNLGQTLLSADTGATGQGTLATIVFSAKTPGGNNRISHITLDPTEIGAQYLSTLNTVVNGTAEGIATTLVNGQVLIGSLPDMVVSAISTTPSNGSLPTYHLDFTIQDTVAATTASSSATYAINGVVAGTVTVGPLAVGGTQSFDETLTTTGTDNITVTADSAGTYGESNNTNSISYTILPDLVVSAISTSPTSSSSSPSTTPTYTISYTITNNGPAAAVASNTAIVINGGTPINIACGALASGASLNFTSAAQTVTGTHDSIVVTADSGHGIQEWNENNNSAIDDYYYTSPNVISGNQDITGTLNTVFSFTAPAAVNQWTYTGNTGSASAAFFPGQNNINAVPNTMVVNSNQSWAVTASGENGGYLSKWNSGYASPIVSLGHQLFVASSSNQGSVVYSLYFNNSAQTLATGNTTGLNSSSGYSRTIPVNYIQNVTYNDAALASPYIYHMTATYTCTTTAY